MQVEGLRETPVDYARIIGRYRGEQPGPTMLVVAGIHGNEPAGVMASRRVLDLLEERRPAFRGEFIAVAGNTRALARGVRFLELDLNRQWIPEKVERLRAEGELTVPEDVEQRELLESLEMVVSQARGEVYFVDLHTSSAEGVPFVTIGDTLRNRRFARMFPLPVILGLEEQIDGALLEYMNNRGFVTFGVEGGQHQSEEAVRFKTAAMLLAIVHAGQIDRADLPEYDAMYRLLDAARRGAPRVMEVRHRHAITAEDSFRMRPGFANFDPVEKGAIVADDRRGPIRVRESGLLLLPLYQGQGDDGFFTGRAVSPFWLHVSRALRLMDLPNYVFLLPGVRRHPTRTDTLVVNTRVARLFPLQLFHLLGFRKRRQLGSTLMVTRRRFDRSPRIS